MTTPVEKEGVTTRLAPQNVFGQLLSSLRVMLILNAVAAVINQIVDAVGLLLNMLHVQRAFSLASCRKVVPFLSEGLDRVQHRQLRRAGCCVKAIFLKMSYHTNVD